MSRRHSPPPPLLRCGGGLTKDSLDPESPTLYSLRLKYSKEDLDGYTHNRASHVARKSQDWIIRSSAFFWRCTRGNVSYRTMNDFQLKVIREYSSRDSWNKILTFGRAFLDHLSRTHFDIRYKHFNLFLEVPRAVKQRKTISERIVTIQDIRNLIDALISNGRDGRLAKERMHHHIGFTLFGAYSGQRVESTIGTLLTSQFIEALESEPPVLVVDHNQDKIRMDHYVPIHPDLIPILTRLIHSRARSKPLFGFMSYQQWLKRNKIPLLRSNMYFVPSDLRKFTEQHGDIIQWDQSNRAYIMTHAVSGIDWKHYKRPLPEDVYRIYMKYWAGVHIVRDSGLLS